MMRLGRDGIAVSGILGAVLAVGLFATAACGAAPVEVSSPSGQVGARIWANSSGRLTLAVSLNGKPVLEPSPLGYTVNDQDLGAGVEPGTPTTETVNETFAWRGLHSTAVNHYSGAKIPVTHAASKTSYTLEVRAYDSGIAFRYVVPGTGKRTVNEDSTIYKLPADALVWHLSNNYEGNYVVEKATELGADAALAKKGVVCPATFELPGGAGYGAILDADALHYAGLWLTPVPGGFQVRSKDMFEGELKTVWHVILAGDLNTIVNSDIVPACCPPPDPKYFPKGLDTDWIKPGKSLWNYKTLKAGEYPNIVLYAKLAPQTGVDYLLIDIGWENWQDGDKDKWAMLKEVVDLAGQGGVKVFVWRHASALRSTQQRKEFFAKCREIGVVGVKMDWMTGCGDNSGMMKAFREILQDAAEYQIMMNFHGCNKPSGESRTWPNEITREAIGGMENPRGPRHDTILPFTRMLAGHADYTPNYYSPHQLATSIILTSPFNCYIGHPERLLQSPALEMFKSIPATWDETVVLPMSRIGELVVFARRKGDVWFLAVMDGTQPAGRGPTATKPANRKLDIPLTFLGQGEYAVAMLKDELNAKKGQEIMKTESGAAAAGQTLAVEMLPGGGFVARFTPRGSGQ